MDLNVSQQQAVIHNKGPLLIVAGAGTGKTTVIIKRIEWLIKNQKIDPHRIFAATYTQKAAEEMLSRLDVIMPLSYQEPWIGTFHSIADKILRDQGLEIGLNPNYRILTQTDQWLFIKANLNALNLKYYAPLGNPNKFISALLKFFSRLQDEDVGSEEFFTLVDKKSSLINVESSSDLPKEYERLNELAHAYKAYEILKHQESVLDFGDLIRLSLKLFRNRPNILKKFQELFSHILVDEFQDTNFAQFELIKLLAPPTATTQLTVVGDDNQSIYKFRGASVSNILQFMDLYPQATRVILNDNYRSTQAILDASYKLIQNNNPDTLEAKLKINKRLISRSQLSSVKPMPPKAIEFPTLEEETRWTAQEIVKLVTKHTISYKDIAILTRTNSALENYALTLKRYGIPYQLVANRGLFDQDEVKNLIYFLRVLFDPTDTQSLFPLTQIPQFSIPANEIFSLIAISKRKSTSLWHELSQYPHPNAANLVNSITQYQQLASSQIVSRVLYQFVLDSGYINQFVKVESVENQLKIKNINLFFNKVKQFEHVSDQKNILSFLTTLDQWLEAGEDPGQAQIEDIDTVHLMTVHAAKGLEFDSVFIGGLVANRFPSNNRTDLIEVPEELIKAMLPTGNSHLQEERRLMYVALTRAKNHLYLTYSLDVGGIRKRRASGFVSETGLLVSKDSIDINSINLISPTTSPIITQVINNEFVLKQVSYSQLNTFKKCPLQYKFRYILQIPAKPQHSISFGRSIHATLHSFHSLEMRGTKPPLLQDLLKLYQANFIEEGYESPSHKAARYQQGIEDLTRYFKEYKKYLGKPIMLEQSFKLKIDSITVVGKIDRIDENSDGTITLIDYKTGTPKNQKEVDRNQQLTLYALAASQSLKINPQNLGLYFLEPPSGLISTSRTPKQTEAAKDAILKQIDEIKHSKFPAKPSDFNCSNCPYNRLCPFAAYKS